jgi:hypothetical protein
VTSTTTTAAATAPPAPTDTGPSGMRETFGAVVVEEMENDPRVAVVLAVISAGMFRRAAVRHPGRVIDLGIREQAMIGTAGGLALTGLRPVVHSYAPFLVERPFEQIKLDLGHQDAGAVLVSIGGSYDAAAEGRTHQAPGAGGPAGDHYRPLTPRPHRHRHRAARRSDDLAQPDPSGLRAARRGHGPPGPPTRARQHPGRLPQQRPLLRISDAPLLGGELMTESTPARRLFVLLVWSPSLGVPADPVGVLGTEEQGDSPQLDSHVSWVPSHDGNTWPWQERLRTAGPLTPELLDYWLEQDGTVHLIEEEQVPEAPSLSRLVEGHLDQVLVELAVGEGR